jgi:hypothetical protein
VFEPLALGLLFSLLSPYFLTLLFGHLFGHTLLLCNLKLVQLVGSLGSLLLCFLEFFFLLFLVQKALAFISLLDLLWRLKNSTPIILTLLLERESLALLPVLLFE